MDVKREDLKAFLILTRNALSNVCYSQGDIEVLDEEIKDLRAEISVLETRLDILLNTKVKMQSALEASDVASKMLDQIAAGENFVINVTN